MSNALDELLRLAAELEKQAETETHKRLKVELNSWAKQSFGFDTPEGKLPNKRVPDAYLSLVSDGKKLFFVGDAKFSETQPPSDDNSASQLHDYVGQFRQLLVGGAAGGVIAVATDTREAAEGWREWLNLCVKAWRIRDKDGKSGPFKIVELKKNTFIVWW